MHVQGPSINVNGPGVNAYPGGLNVNGMPVNAAVNNGGYTTSTTTTTYQSQQAMPQTNSYQVNEQHFRSDGYNGQYGYNGDGSATYEQVGYNDHTYVESEKSGCCNRRNRLFGNEFGHKRFGNAYGGNPSTLCCRRCCTGILIALGLLALLGLILGLVFGLRAAASSSTTTVNPNLKSNGLLGGYQGGYYVNGVYYVPITAQPRRFYMIYGTEKPCAVYNTSLPTTAKYNPPNCADLTTRITQVDWWSTTTPRTMYFNGYSSATSLLPTLITLIVPYCVSVIVQLFI